MHSSWKSFKPETGVPNTEEKKKILPLTRTFHQTKQPDDSSTAVAVQPPKEHPNKKQKMEDQIAQTKIEIKQVCRFVQIFLSFSTDPLN